MVQKKDYVEAVGPRVTGLDRQRKIVLWAVAGMTALATVAWFSALNTASAWFYLPGAVAGWAGIYVQLRTIRLHRNTTRSLAFASAIGWTILLVLAGWAIPFVLPEGTRPGPLVSVIHTLWVLATIAAIIVIAILRGRLDVAAHDDALDATAEAAERHRLDELARIAWARSRELEHARQVEAERAGGVVATSAPLSAPDATPVASPNAQPVVKVESPDETQ